MYVCGITPYDATHMGHAATYVTFDVLGRALRDAGHEVLYVQNVTDVDEPLLERAQRDGVAWQDLAAGEIALFREDMTALAVIAPDHYIGVVEAVDQVAKTVGELLSKGSRARVGRPRAAGQGVAGASGSAPRSSRAASPSRVRRPGAQPRFSATRSRAVRSSSGYS